MTDKEQPIESDEGRRPSPWSSWVALSILLVVTAVLYARVVNFELVNWDDDLYVINNPCIAGGASFQDWVLTPRFGYAIPVTNLSLVVEAYLTGDAPWLSHTTNVLIHLLVVGLVFALARRLGLSVTGAFCAAALLALHPLSVEPVSWVTGRKDLLGAAFGVAALWVMATPSPSRAAPWIAAALSALSLLSKPQLVALPILLLALSWRWGQWEGRPHRRQGLMASGAVLIVAVALSAVAMVQNRAVGGVTASVPAMERLHLVAGALTVQVENLVVPLNLAPRYAPPSGGFSATIIAQGIAIGLGLLAALLWAGRRCFLGGVSASKLRGDGAAPTSAAAVGILLAVLAYVPVSNVVPLTRFAADSYLYAPLVGLGLVLGGAFDGARARDGRAFSRALSVALVVVGCLFAVATYRAVAVWRSPVTLWRHGFAALPDSPQACRSLGNALMWEDAPRDAAATYTLCLDRFDRPDLYLRNLGIALVVAGEHEQALSVLDEASEGRPGDPVIDRYRRLARKGLTMR